MAKVAPWVFTKKRGYPHTFLTPGSFADTWHEQQKGYGICCIFEHFAPAGYRTPSGLAKAFGGLQCWKDWLAGAFDCDKYTDDDLKEVLAALEGWAELKLLPCHYIGKLDGVWGIWPDIDAAIEDGAEVNERGNVTYFYHSRRHKRAELFSYV